MKRSSSPASDTSCSVITITMNRQIPRTALLAATFCNALQLIIAACITSDLPQHLHHLQERDARIRAKPQWIPIVPILYRILVRGRPKNLHFCKRKCQRICRGFQLQCETFCRRECKKKMRQLRKRCRQRFNWEAGKHGLTIPIVIRRKKGTEIYKSHFA